MQVHSRTCRNAKHPFLWMIGCHQCVIIKALVPFYVERKQSECTHVDWYSNGTVFMRSQTILTFTFRESTLAVTMFMGNDTQWIIMRIDFVQPLTLSTLIYWHVTYMYMNGHITSWNVRQPLDKHLNGIYRYRISKWGMVCFDSTCLLEKKT